MGALGFAIEHMDQPLGKGGELRVVVWLVVLLGRDGFMPVAPGILFIIEGEEFGQSFIETPVVCPRFKQFGTVGQQESVAGFVGDQGLLGDVGAVKVHVHVADDAQREGSFFVVELIPRPQAFRRDAGYIDLALRGDKRHVNVSPDAFEFPLPVLMVVANPCLTLKDGFPGFAADFAHPGAIEFNDELGIVRLKIVDGNDGQAGKEKQEKGDDPSETEEAKGEISGLNRVRVDDIVFRHRGFICHLVSEGKSSVESGRSAAW